MGKLVGVMLAFSLGCSSVAAPPVIESFTASPAALPVGGGTVTLAWTTTGASSVSIDQGVGAVTPVASGTQTATATATTTYTLTATNSDASVTKTASVCVSTGGVTAVASSPADFNVCNESFQTAISVTNLTCTPVTVTTIVIDSNPPACNLHGNYTLNPVPTIASGQTLQVFNLLNGTICCNTSPCTINCTSTPTWTVTTSAGVIPAVGNMFSIDISNCNQTC